MERRERLSVGIHMFGACADRFVTSSYKDAKEIADLVKAAVKSICFVETLLGAFYKKMNDVVHSKQ